MNVQVHRLIASLTILLSLAGSTDAQRRSRLPHRLDRSKPFAYISANAALTNDPNLFRLEFHNNTPWKIMCYLTPGQSNTGNAPVIYKVQDAKRNEIYSNVSGDVVFPRTILPGRSVPFTVSREHLKHGYTIYVEFNYEWETRDGISPYGVEPNHRVFFGWYDLPKTASQ